MKKVYWRPQRTSARVLVVLALAALVGLISVETFLTREVQPYYKEKMAAARLARQAFRVLKRERLKRGLFIDTESDPAQSGLIGQLISPVTTNTGHLPAKQATINPNFAAVMVHLLKRARINSGDTVAVGLSGSFPALNTTVVAALQTLKLKPLIVSSAGASQWGANIPGFMWPDMETLLHRNRLISFHSLAVSPGGIDDRALGLSRQGKQLIEQAILRNGLTPMEVKSYMDGLVQRMALYKDHSEDAEIKAYINVGGGTTSVGTHVGKHLFKPGLNRRPPRGANIDSVMTRFANRGLPVIHLTQVDVLCQRYGLTAQPLHMPAVGEGKIFSREVYNKYLAGGVLVTLLLMLVALLRMDWGYRLFPTNKKEGQTGRPEQMV